MNIRLSCLKSSSFFIRFVMFLCLGFLYFAYYLFVFDVICLFSGLQLGIFALFYLFYYFRGISEKKLTVETIGLSCLIS
mgnify:CR=1 FL=1